MQAPYSTYHLGYQNVSNFLAAVLGCPIGGIAKKEVDEVVFSEGEVEDGGSDKMEHLPLAELQLQELNSLKNLAELLVERLVALAAGVHDCGLRWTEVEAFN